MPTGGQCLLTSGMTKSPVTSLALLEFFDDLKFRLDYWYQHQLGNAVSRLDDEVFLAAVPARYKQLPLVVGIDKSNQIAQHNAVFVA